MWCDYAILCLWQDEQLHSVHAKEVAELSVADQTVQRYSSQIYWEKMLRLAN